MTTSTLTMTYKPTTSAQTKPDNRTMFTESIKTEEGKYSIMCMYYSRMILPFS